MTTDLPVRPGALETLAERAGVALTWTSETGQPQALSEGTLRRVLTALGHPCDGPAEIDASLTALQAAQAAPALLTARVGERIAVPLPADTERPALRVELTLESGEVLALQPLAGEGSSGVSLDPVDVPGYHRLTLTSPGRSRSVGLAIAPPRAFDGGLRDSWGTAVQLHALRPESTRTGPDPGLGDLGALAAFAACAGAAGADVLAISPTHAGFAADASQISPYSPSSRLFHNVLYIDPVGAFGAAVAGEAARAAGIDGDMPASGDAPLIDWRRAAASKMRWLRALFAMQPAEDDDPELPEALRLHATFEALHTRFHAEGLDDWHHWPLACQDAASVEVAAHARAHAAEIRFHVWLQRLAEDGLRRAQQAATEAGMRVGLVSDLAIGMLASGSHAWASRGDLLDGLEIGAPPDAMNANGQRWGLTTFSPLALLRNGCAPFIATLRAAMRQAGGVRIDHVLGLNRLWLIPPGASAAEGAYVHYPLRDLINLLILESHRNRAIVIGEDLGTVPPGFRDLLADAGILGMSVLWLERAADGIGFTPPRAWSANSVAMTTTHDLPTVAGWWCSRDIDWRERLGADGTAARRQREVERAALAALAPGIEPGEDGVALSIEAIAGSPAGLLLVPLEDLLGLVEQPNLPGTVDEHPNWRRRLPLPADRLLEDPSTLPRLSQLQRLRPG